MIFILSTNLNIVNLIRTKSMMFEDNTLQMVTILVVDQSMSGYNSPVQFVAFDSSEILVLAGASSGVIKLWVLEEAKSSSCDIWNMTKETVKIVTNKEVIAVNQDPFGVQGKKVRMEGDFEVHCFRIQGSSCTAQSRPFGSTRH